MTDDLEALRRRLKAALPHRIAAAAEGYDQFTADPPGLDAKSFAAHHAACKSALAHIELLIKLARWASGELAQTQPEGDEELESLLAEARAALAQDETQDEDAS
jgi:hypothetical protein